MTMCGPTSRLKIILSGMVAGVPYHGGATWAVLQYVLGLERLGHAVYLIEPIQPSALQPAGTELARSSNAAYFQHVSQAFGLQQRSALLLQGTRQTVGLSYEQLLHASDDADLLINISGMLDDENLVRHIPRRAYLDLDPVFTQLWHEAQGIDMRFEGHTHFVTVGLAIGQPSCSVPTCGRSWITTLQPVLLAEWPATTEVDYNALTTVGNWRSYGSITYQGLLYGQKAHAFRTLFELPRRTTERFTLALAIDPNEHADLAALKDNGWHLLDPARYTRMPADYRRFIQRSMAEFGIAKSGYVHGRCGWFSDRSICYLASGRPVIGQETGFSQFLPTGAGLFAFETADEVLVAIERLQENYTYHARSARALAEAYFDANIVLPSLLDRLGSSA